MSDAKLDLPPGDDAVRGDFLQGRALAQQGNPAAQLDALVTKSVAAPAPAAPVPGAQPAPQQTQDQIQASDDTTRWMAETGGIPAPMGRKILSGIWATAKDVALGTAQSPAFVERGLAGAYGETAKTGMALGDALDRVFPKWLSDVWFAGNPAGPLSDDDKQAIVGMGKTPEQQAQIAKMLSPAARADAITGLESDLKMPVGAESTTGNFIEGATQFLAGRKPVLSAADGLMPKLGRELLADFVSGAATTDTSQPRISNIIDQVAPNFVTDWLKAKPGDEGTLLGRLKAGLEYAGLGSAFAGIKSFLGYAKDSMTSSDGLGGLTDLGQGPTGALETTEGPAASAATTGDTAVTPAKPFLPLGDTAADLVSVDPEMESKAGDYLSGVTGDNPVKINLARIGSGDDIKAALEAVSKTIPDDAVQSNESTILAADALGMKPEDFLAGYKGQNLNAAETTAMRFMLDSSASQLIKYAEAARDPTTGTPEAKATFLKAFATHRALQQYFENARAEAGRTLQAWSIMSQQRSDYAKQIGDLIERTGQDDIDNMASRIADLGDPLKASRLVAASMDGTGRDGFLKTYYNVLLSNPKTVIKKLASDTFMGVWNVATRAAASAFGSGAVPQGEASELAYGYVSSLRDAVRIAGRGIAAGESQFFRDYQSMDALHTARLSALANGAPEVLANDEPIRAGMQYLKGALPTSWIGAADDFAKYANYRAEVRSLAFRDGVGKGLDGPDLSAHIEQTLDNVPPDIHQQAITNVLKNTFQEPLTGLAERLQGFMDNFNIPLAHTDFQIPAGRILMPFIKVPANIAKWAYSNSPLPLAFPSAAFKAELTSSGASRDIALAKIGLGTILTGGALDLALGGYITGRGPSDPSMQRAWRSAGNEPYSIQLPGQRPVGYNQIEPIGLMLGALADTVGIGRFAKDQDAERTAASMIFGAGNAMLSKTYMEGVANFFDAMNDPEKEGRRWQDNLVTSMVVPQGASGLAKALDPWVRQHYGLLDTIESRLPYLSEGLPPARTLWGDPIPQRDGFLPGFTGTGAARMLSPVPLGQDPKNVEPIDKWIWNNRQSFPEGDQGRLGLSKPGIVQTFSNGNGLSTQIELTPAQHDRLQVLAGNGLKGPTGLGAKDYLNALVEGKNPDQSTQREWDEASPSVKALMVQKIVNGYRAGARKQLLSDYQNIQDAAQAGWSARAKELQGAQ